MEYFTPESLFAVARRQNASLTESSIEATLRYRASPLQESASAQTPLTKPALLFDIFLSHSSVDKRSVDLAYLALTALGFKVYLDRLIDPQLNPTYVTKTTATIIRRRLAQSRSMFVATSANTTQSKWVPWELGFTDGWNGKAAILPIVDRPITAFGGQEYFALYPEAKYAPGQSSVVIDDGNQSRPWIFWVNAPRTI